MNAKNKIIYKYTLFALLLLVSNICYSYSENNLKLFSELSFQNSKDSTLIKLYKKADSLYKTKNYTTSLKFALKVIDESNLDTDLELISSTHYLIGRIWYASRAYEKAIAYFQKNVSDNYRIIAEKTMSDEDIVENKPIYNFNILNGNLQLGNSYLRLYELFLDEIEKDSINKLHKGKAFYYYNKILESNSLSKDVLVLKSKAYYNMSGIYVRDSAYIKAEEFALKSIEIEKKLGDKYSLAAGYNALSNIHFFKEEYNESKKILALGLESISNIKGKKADEIRAGLFMNTAFSMYKLKDYKAYEVQEKAYELYDKIKDRDTEQKIADIYADRNFNSGLQEGIFQQEIKRQTAQRNTWIIGISSFFVIILLAFFLNQYKLKQKNFGLKLSQTELIQNQNIEKLKSDSQIKVLNATIDGKESERKEIAETLHDSVSALLSSANLHLQATRKQFNGKTPLEIDKTQEIITEASQKIRDLSHTLVSSVLLKFGLNFAIKDLAEKYSNSQLTIETDIEDIKRYYQSFEIKAYNIIQEFLNNILKHSNAKNASIFIREKDNSLCIKISDDGKGFDKTTITEKDGLGINQIDARIQMMNGKFQIESIINKGTIIEVELPILEKEKFNHV